jgi:hypothetical protein
MPKDEYIKQEDKQRYHRPLELGHPNYSRRKMQAWLKILGPKKLSKTSPNYHGWYLEWAWKKMQAEKLDESDLKYLKEVLRLKWIEIDNHWKKQPKKESN